ncbi:MAG: hypothetical protein ACT4OK_10275 [Gemmobacter sp.]
MAYRDITLRLSEVTLAALELAARAEDTSVNHIIRDAIDRDLRRRAPAKTPVRADERLVAPLRALLADDFAYAQGWADLIARLAHKGFLLVESGGGLLLRRSTGERLCKASELGYSYSRLLSRFDAPFPGHAHDAALSRVRQWSAAGRH